MCVWVGLRMKRRAKEHRGMLRIQWIERKKESRRERGAWHCSSLNDGSSSGLRHGLPLISLSLDMKLRRKVERRVAEGTKQETFAGACARLIFTLYCFYFKAHNNTHLPANTHTVDCKNRNDELWLTIGMTFIWTGLVPTHESFIAFWSIDMACNKYIWPQASPSLNYTHIKIALMTPVLKSLTHMKQGVGLAAKKGICKENTALGGVWAEVLTLIQNCVISATPGST